MDTAQPDSGADVNALRTNVPVGESREFEVTDVRGTTVAARVEGSDVDADNVTFVPEDFRPAVGEVCVFTHAEEGRFEVSAKVVPAAEVPAETPAGEPNVDSSEQPAA